MGVEFRQTTLPGVILCQMQEFADSRGHFLESYHSEKYQKGAIGETFVQDNYSHSKRGVLRGLHYQVNQPQGKLVHVLRGEIFDVAVDIRKNSPHFGKWYGTNLSGENRRQIYVPEGFAHGFCTLSAEADVVYKCTDLYSPENERSLIWNDPDVNISWPIEKPSLSEKDAAGLKLADLKDNDLPDYKK